MFRSVLYAIENGIARITLNRPEKRNALDAVIIGEIKQALAQAEDNPAARVAILAGAGKDFCSGADLAALERIREAGVLDNLADARHMADLFLQIRNARLPVLAAVHGRALAGGCGLATACDIVLASDAAQFGYPEVNIGFIPAMVMAILRRAIPEKAAFELIVTGETISAARALELGLVQQVFPAAGFDDAVHSYTRQLADKPGAAVSLAKNLLYHMDAMSFDAAMQSGVQANAIARMTDDCRHGVDRFLNKLNPDKHP